MHHFKWLQFTVGILVMFCLVTETQLIIFKNNSFHLYIIFNLSLLKEFTNINSYNMRHEIIRVLISLMGKGDILAPALKDMKKKTNTLC